jgi:hypothetical protein
VKSLSLNAGPGLFEKLFRLRPDHAQTGLRARHKLRVLPEADFTFPGLMLVRGGTTYTNEVRGTHSAPCRLDPLRL